MNYKLYLFYFFIAYYTSEAAKPVSRPLFHGTANTTKNILCLYNVTLCYCTKKAGLTLRFRPLLLADLRPYNMLQQPTAYDISSSLISFIESLINLIHDLESRSLLQQRNRLLYDIFLTLTREDLLPSCVRQQILLINCQLLIVEYLLVKTSLSALLLILRSLRQLLVRQRTIREPFRKTQRLLACSLSSYKIKLTSLESIQITSTTLIRLASRQALLA